MLCKICSSSAKEKFEALFLKKYVGAYYQCTACGFLFVNEPTWLDEAYMEAINSCDTGILARNIRLRELASILIFHFFNRNGTFLDYAGGYGIFTRLMRDIGFDYYWIDKYSQNLFAQGFESRTESSVELVTAFEVFEHLNEPLKDIDQMLKYSRNILFTTELLPDPLPNPDEWWYYGVDHGQHISFYTQRSIELLAKARHLNYYRFEELHLLTEKEISKIKFQLIRKFHSKLKLFKKLQRNMSSKTIADMNHVLSLNKNA